jgi:predicted house-cleaning noncanonical NTP pyrophosphatase (MazG superfamily)
MLNLTSLQKEIYESGVKDNSFKSDVPVGFCQLMRKVTESYDSWVNRDNNTGEKLAEIMILTLGIAEMLGYDVEREIKKKIDTDDSAGEKLAEIVILSSGIAETLGYDIEREINKKTNQ